MNELFQSLTIVSVKEIREIPFILQGLKQSALRGLEAVWETQLDKGGTVLKNLKALCLVSSEFKNFQKIPKVFLEE
jgi:hypothetical protein